MELITIQLRKNEDRRLKGGHLWVYSNEVDTQATPLRGLTPGQAVRVVNHQGRCIGTGYINPNSLICIRLLAGPAEHPFDPRIFRQRLVRAIELRERHFAQPYYRLVFGEGDGLPGLVVDRYGDVLVCQFNTCGIEQAREIIIASLRELLAPSGILLRNDSPVRLAEGLATTVEVAFGEIPEQTEICENAVNFLMPLLGGQKTGWYFDHRDNRRRALRYVADARVLDCFSYQGAWGIQAAVAGARQVSCVDASQAALDRVTANAEHNGVGARVETHAGDAFKLLKQFAQDNRAFDVVIMDPPAFVKRRKDMDAGLEAYQRLNQLALGLLPPGGILVTASCSSHVEPTSFMNVLRQASARSHRRIQILEQGHQGIDHPIHPAIPETDYLKCLVARVLD